MPTAAIIALIAGALSTLYLAILELRKQEKSYPKIIFYLSLCLISLGASIYDKLFSSNSISNNSTPISPVRRFASLYVCNTPDGRNPKIFHTNNSDSMLLSFTICNKGNIDAVDIKDFAALAIRTQGEFSLASKKHFSGANKFTRVAPNSASIVAMPVFFRENGANFFACLKIKYTSENLITDSLIEIIKLDKNLINGGLAIRANMDEVDEIEKYLVDEGIW